MHGCVEYQLTTAAGREKPVACLWIPYFAVFSKSYCGLEWTMRHAVWARYGGPDVTVLRNPVDLP